MDKGLTVPKWVLINCAKIPQMPQQLFIQIVCPSPYFGISLKKGSIGRSQSVANPKSSKFLENSFYEVPLVHFVNLYLRNGVIHKSSKLTLSFIQAYIPFFENILLYFITTFLHPCFENILLYFTTTFLHPFFENILLYSTTTFLHGNTLYILNKCSKQMYYSCK